MNKLFCILAITLAMIVGVHLTASSLRDGLYPHSWYAGFDALYLLLGCELVLAAFCLVRKGHAIGSRAALARCCMIGASLSMLLGVVDLAIMALVFDTSGLGGIRCFTHANWHKRFARSNQLGYWERDLTPYLDSSRPHGELVIAAVGDSWTWGQGIRGKERRFTNLLEAELRSDSAAPVDVLNFGRAGADTNEERLLLKDAAKVRPDIVLIGYLANDIDRYASVAPFTVDESPVWHRLALLSPTLNLIYWRVVAPRAYGEFSQDYGNAVRGAYATPAIMARHLEDIEQLVAEVRAINAKPIFVILPFPALWRTNADGGGLCRQVRDEVYGKIAAKVESLNVPVIAAQGVEDEMSPAEFALNPMDNHPSEAAHRRIAKVVADEMRQRNLLHVD